MRRRAENDLSAVAVVTGMVMYIRMSFSTAEKISLAIGTVVNISQIVPRTVVTRRCEYLSLFDMLSTVPVTSAVAFQVS